MVATYAIAIGGVILFLAFYAGLRRIPLLLLFVGTAVSAALAACLMILCENLFKDQFTFSGIWAAWLHIKGVNLPKVEVLADAFLLLVCLLGATRVCPILDLDHKTTARAQTSAAVLFIGVYAYLVVDHWRTLQPQLLILETALGMVICGLVGIAGNLALRRAYFPGPISRFPAAPLARVGVRMAIFYQGHRRGLRVLARGALVLCLLAVAVLIPQSNARVIVLYQTNPKKAGEPPQVVRRTTYAELAGYFRSKGDLVSALDLARQALREQPGSYEIQVLNAALLADHRQFEEALRTIDQAIRQKPQDPLGYFHKTLALEASGQYSQALETIKKARELTADKSKSGSTYSYSAALPDDEELRLYEAALSVYAGSYDQSLQQVAALDNAEKPSSAGDLIAGMAYLAKGDARTAQEKYAGASNRIAGNSIGSSLSQSAASLIVPLSISTSENQTLPAIAQFEDTGAIYFYPKDLVEREDYVYSQALTKIVIAQDPYIIDAANSANFLFYNPEPVLSLYSNLVNGRFVSKESTMDYLSPALTALAKTRRLETAREIYRSLADWYSSLNLQNKAIEYYRLAGQAALSGGSDGSKEFAVMYYDLGVVAYNEKRYDAAVENLSKSLSYDPQSPDALYLRSQAYLQLGKMEPAAADLKSLLGQDPTRTAAVIDLGHCLDYQEQYSAAIETLKGVTDSGNKNAWYYHYLGFGYIGAGERDLAVDSYQHFISSQFAYSSDSSQYQVVIDDLARIAERQPKSKPIVKDVMLLLQGAISRDSRFTQVTKTAPTAVLSFAASKAAEDQAAGPAQQKAGAAPSAQLPLAAMITQRMYLRLETAGPQSIRPGSSDVFNIVAELSPDYSPGPLTVPLDLVVGHAYAIEVRIHALNFDVTGEAEGSSRPLEPGKPVTWKWVLAPRPGYEGNQNILYDLVVRDQADNAVIQEIPAASIAVEVLTRYGIPAQILNPIGGIAGFAGGVLALPVWTFIIEWLKEKRKKAEKEKDALSGAEQARQYAVKHYIEPARKRGEGQVTFSAAEIHAGLGLTNRYPSVCAAIDAEKFIHEAGVTLLQREGPCQGAAARWTFQV